MPRSSYRELPPPPELRRWVYRRWEQRVGPGRGGYRQRVLPDGHADVLVDGGGRAVLVGPATGVAVPELAPDSVLHGLRLTFDVVGSLFRVPAAELVDQVVPLSALLPAPLAAALTETLTEALTEALTETLPQMLPQTLLGTARAAAVAGEWAPGTGGAEAVVRRWLEGAAPPDAQVRAAVRALWTEPAVPVARLAERVGWSERQLRRALRAEVGLGPKTFQRVARLRRFLALATADPGRGLAELAAEAGYADQPHLSREARALAGLTAAELVAFQLG